MTKEFEIEHPMVTNLVKLIDSNLKDNPSMTLKEFKAELEEAIFIKERDDLARLIDRQMNEIVREVKGQ